MADFGGLAINLQAIQSNEISLSRGVKSAKKSDLSSQTNVRVNPKLLQLLKDNQDELNDDQQIQLDDLNKQTSNLDTYAHGGGGGGGLIMHNGESDENRVSCFFVAIILTFYCYYFSNISSCLYI
jgi:hypothetical protein